MDDLSKGSCVDSDTPGVPPTTHSNKPDMPADADADIIVTELVGNGSGSVINTMHIVDPQPTAVIITPPSTLSNAIDPDRVPPFLLSHGTGNCKVNIFNYLNEVKDPHFQQVLYHYLNFEISDKSCAVGSLPTAKCPPEIAQQAARVHPALLPDYLKGKRTFLMFVDLIIAWWSSLQPSWRSFEWGAVSRQIHGEWGHLYAPCINGLLNVVILVYWWSRILEEQKPTGGVCADYKFFANDVSWVLSNLST